MHSLWKSARSSQWALCDLAKHLVVGCHSAQTSSACSIPRLFWSVNSIVEQMDPLVAKRDPQWVRLPLSGSRTFPKGCSTCGFQQAGGNRTRWNCPQVDIFNHHLI